MKQGAKGLFSQNFNPPSVIYTKSTSSVRVVARKSKTGIASDLITFLEDELAG